MGNDRETVFCLHCHAVIAKDATSCPNCGSAWRAEAVPSAQMDDTAWHVRDVGEVIADLEVLLARLGATCVRAQQVARARDRVRKEAVERLASTLFEYRRDLASAMDELKKLQQSLAAMGG